MNLDRIPVGSGQGEDLAHRGPSMFTGKLKDLERKRGQFGKHKVFAFDLFPEPPHLLLKRTQEECQPRLPVGVVCTDGLLSLAQSEVVTLLAVLDHAFERAVGRVGIAAAKQEE